MYNFFLNHFWNAPKIAKTFCLKFAVQIYMTSSVGIKKLVRQSGIGFLILCIPEHAQRPLVDFLKFQPIDFWKISIRASVQLNKHENPYYILRDHFHPFCSNKSTVKKV